MTTYPSSIRKFTVKIRRVIGILSLVLFFAAPGCQPFQQRYYGERGRETGGLVSREYAGIQETGPLKEEENAAVLQTLPPGRIKPVSYTAKSFDGFDSEADSLSQSSALGKVEWADWEEPSSDENEVKELIEAAPLSEAETAIGTDDHFISPAEPIEENSDEAKAVSLAAAESLSEGDGEGMIEEQDWHKAAGQAIQLLQEKIKRRVKNGENCPAEEARLQLLLLTVGNSPDTAEKIAGLDPNLQLFWEQECRGLGLFIETQEKGDPKDQLMKKSAAELQNGVSTLKSYLPISVKKSLFVKEPALFGYYEEVSPSFKPGETVNVYFELDNVVCREEENGEGCSIAVLCRRDLTDSLNQPVLETREKLCSGRAGSRLNDIVLNLSLRLPEDLPEGTYILKTIFLDRNSEDAEPVAESMELRVESRVNPQTE